MRRMPCSELVEVHAPLRGEEVIAAVKSRRAMGDDAHGSLSLTADEGKHLIH